MTEEEKTEQSAEIETPTTETENPVEQKGLVVFVIISLVFAIAAAAGVGVSWFKNEQQLSQQTQSINSLKGKADSLQQAQRNNKSTSSAMQASINIQRQNISKQLGQITEKFGRNQHDWAVSEIRYTLRQANMRLQLFKDKATALVALQLADDQLAKLADPALHRLRGIVSKEIATLKVVKEIDLEGVSLKLTALAGQVENLEARITGRSKQSNSANIPLDSSTKKLPQWQMHINEIWKELKTLITIRRTDKKILPLLSEQELQQLRQALSLKIEMARLALLQQNTALFRSSLKTASSWLEDYFNIAQPAVAAIKTELASLMTLQLEPNYPDISGSLSMLEQLQAGKAVKAKKSPVKKTETKIKSNPEKLAASQEKRSQ